MKKIVFGMLALILCAACSKKEEEEKPKDLNKEEVVGDWFISDSPKIEVVIKSDEHKDKAASINEFLGKCFKQNDKWKFGEGDTIKISRNGISVDTPSKYEIKEYRIVLDGYIEFSGSIDLNSESFVLTAGNKEIKNIVKSYLTNNKATFFPALSDSDLKFILDTVIPPLVSGEVKFTLKKEKAS